ncbi:hypothetical protein [Nitratireductor luteus]|uniref:hypothetical protein n=1 Tax=Nitratireductor luteus TaxID=2976980 RepID=UPI00223FCCCF|nr:hypothetical protein [Nitratireductor luteus]
MSTLTQSVLAAVRGRRKGSRLEDDRTIPEEMEEEEKEAEEEEKDPDVEEEDRDPDAEDEEEKDEADLDDEEKDPDAEEEEEGKQAGSAKVRRAEQSRIRSILTHPKADANPGLASELAFGKRFYSAKAAGALLDHSGGSVGRLAGRMKGKSPRIGSEPHGSPATERQTLVSNVRQTIQALHGRKPASK